MTRVFVHGNPETAAIWTPLLDSLGSRGVHDVMTLSPPGFGAPAPPGWEATPARYVDWLVDEVEQIGAPVDLVGHDWGAGHVYGLAAERPDLIRTWAADCAGLIHPDYEWHDGAKTWQTPGAGEEAIELMLAFPVGDRASALAGLGLASDAAASMAEAFDADMGRCILELYRAAAQPVMRNLGDRLAAADRRPGLIIDPSDDPYVPTAMAGPVADRLGAERLTLAGAGHWWMLEYAEPVAGGLIALWDGD